MLQYLKSILFTKNILMSTIKIACFNKADFRIFRIFSKVLLGIKIKEKSIGICYLPKIYAKAINRYAEKGYVHMNKTPLTFYVNQISDEELTPTMGDLITESILDVHLYKENDARNSVCVFASNKCLVEILSRMDFYNCRFWGFEPDNQEDQPYHLFLDKNNKLHAEILLENEIFKDLNLVN